MTRHTWNYYIIRIVSLIKPYKIKQAQTLILMTSGIILTLLLPLVLRFFIDDVIGKKRVDLLVPVVIFTLGIFIAAAVFNFLTTYLFNVIAQNIVRDLRRTLFCHITNLPIEFLSRHGTGRIMARVLNDVSTIGHVLSTIMPDFLVQSGTLVVIIIIMLRFNWQLTILAMLSAPVYVILVKYFNERLRTTSHEAMAKHAEVSSMLQECLTGIKEIRSYNRETIELQRFHKRLTDFLKTRIRLGILGASSVQAAFVASSIGMLIVFLYGGKLALADRLSIGTLMAFWAYLGQVYTPIEVLMRMNVQFQDAAAAIRRIDEIFEIKPAITEKPDATHLDNPQGSIELRNVTFFYKQDQPVIRDLSLKIEKGEHIAIVGKSGSGKTTITNLLVRFFDPVEGSILFDGIDLRDLRLADLRMAIALVPQDTILFNESIEDNIRFGNENATEEEIIRAAKIAGVMDFAETLPDRLKTQVGERGISLSGGERQRISIARAILRNPAVLLLDEATSQLDSKAEARLRAALESAFANKTVIMIAHRLSTISSAQRILVLDQGRIAEEGTHQKLLEKEGIYYSLYNEQAAVQQG
ncbi:MAG: ABC transporter ATP-binding protein [bacterium]